MEESKLDKINKTIRRTVKGSPLLIIILLAVIIFVVGAEFIRMYQSSVITHQVSVIGLDAEVYETGAYGTTATALTDWDKSGIIFTDSTTMVYVAGNIASDLKIRPVVTEGGTVFTDWTVKGFYVCYWDNGNIFLTPLGVPLVQNGEGFITIPYADLVKMTRVDAPLPGMAGPTNSLVLCFTFGNGQSWGTYNYEIVIEAFADGGS